MYQEASGICYYWEREGVWAQLFIINLQEPYLVFTKVQQSVFLSDKYIYKLYYLSYWLFKTTWPDEKAGFLIKGWKKHFTSKA